METSLVSLEQVCEGGFRYRDSVRGLDPPTDSSADGDAEEFLDSVVVWRDGEVWCALWLGRRAALGEFEGPRTAALEWARQRSPRCWILSDDLSEVARLDTDTD